MTRITPKPVRVFTREEPCTKVHLANCFLATGEAIPRAVVEARGEIGVNAIKYLKKNALAVEVERDGIDYWVLTDEGVNWLEKGLARHLELHPNDADLLEYRKSGKVRKTTNARRIRRGQR